MAAKVKNIVLVIVTSAFLCGFALWSILKPDDTLSVSERRPLAEFPAVTSASVFSGEFMAAFEEYAPDQFPLRDRFRTLKAFTSFYIFRQKDNHDIYIADGYAAKLEPEMDPASIEYAAERFRFVYDRYLAGKEINVYLSVIPDKNYFMARENGYPAMDYDAFVRCVKDNTDFAAYIDIMPLLSLSDFYRTDTHWRQEKLTEVSRYLAMQMGASLSAEYTTKQVDTPFYGVYYGQAALPLPADDLYYLDNEILSNCIVYDYETDSYLPVYDLTKTSGNDPYEMFLSGSKSLLTIENKAATTNKELILFRDSFGSSIAPLLAEGYNKITLVDIRYLSPELLDRFISFESQDVLFLYSTSVLNHSITIK